MEQLSLNRATEIILDALATPGSATPPGLVEHGRNVLARYSQGNQTIAQVLAIFQGDPKNQTLRPYVVQQLVAIFTQQQAASQEIMALAQQIIASRPQDNIGQRGGLNFGSGRQLGDVSVRDVAGGDINRTETTQGDRITTGDISGTGIAIGRGARSSVRNIDTGGGDYAEGNIDKRKGNFVSGDQFTMSGNFSGAILNIKSTLTNVSQSVGAAPHGDAATKAQLQALIAQLSAELQKVPAEQAGEAEQAAKRAESAVAEATKPNPDKDDVAYSLSRLKKAAENIAQVLPTVLPIATQIADVLRKMIGA
ncbi:hypothetical protein EYB53_024710 [Candidatus Chloroploca sp. M-50]|uniref:Uncharacterized protein n=1 Tax=Candidatus Chloroploca mongolica TaxID=2528176 RepID=A0ABS4DHN3_9CHLR|nr:hypothetical protein [Candidatus Chloroploca mongolica]MBP1468933.1 hypothetical protein [Candidatus Chloroploca mongolica]